MKEQPIAPQANWFESAKESFQDVMDRFNLSSALIINIIFALILGFIAAFTINKLGKFILYIVILFLFVALALQHVQFITIEWEVIKHSFGIYSINSLQDFINMIISIIRQHFIATVAFIVGYMIGGRMF